MAGTVRLGLGYAYGGLARLGVPLGGSGPRTRPPQPPTQGQGQGREGRGAKTCFFGLFSTFTGQPLVELQ